MGYLTHGTGAGGKTYDLLPCPHCGGEAEFRDGSSTKPYIRCKSCGCRTWGSHAYDKLAAAWNRRAERTCRDVGNGDKFVCSECGASFDYEGRWDEPTFWVDDVAAAVGYCPNCGARVIYDD